MCRVLGHQNRSGFGLSGFTLVELIIIMVVIGIIAGVAMPRFFQRSTFEARGFYDEAQAALRYAQKQAMAQRRPVAVGIDAGSATITLCYNAPPPCGAGNPAVLHPATSAAYVVAPRATTPITLAGPNFIFSGSGQPNTVAASTIDITGDGTTRRICVAAVTGYVYTRTPPAVC